MVDKLLASYASGLSTANQNVAAAAGRAGALPVLFSRFVRDEPGAFYTRLKNLQSVISRVGPGSRWLPLRS
jgi:hypothetical protein